MSHKAMMAEAGEPDEDIHSPSTPAHVCIHDPDWKQLVQLARESRSGNNNDVFVNEQVWGHLGALHAQWLLYRNELTGASAKGSELTSAQKKELVLATRASCRFALSCLAIETQSIREQVQEVAVKEHRLHIIVGYILAQTNGDSKCRVLFSKILSNLATNNTCTAPIILEAFPLSPSKAQVSQYLSFSMEKTEGDVPHDIQPTWADIFLSTARAGDRSALAACIAALHNAIAASSDNEPVVADKIANDSILLCILLRHAVSLQTFRGVLQEGPSPAGHLVSSNDEAAEWLRILVVRLCKLGKFERIFLSLSGIVPGSSICVNDRLAVVAEHVVLLSILVSEVEGADQMVFGKQLPDSGGCYDTYTFLVRCRNNIHSQLSDSLDTADSQLYEAASLAILDILASSVAIEFPSSLESIRIFLGASTSILQDCLVELGAFVDKMADRSFQRHSRDLVMTTSEQHFATSLVRLIGNMCFNCKQNQDRLRYTLVPIHCRNVLNEQASLERNGLHVLMSTSAYGHACFTLREWTVVAIRNALEGNPENQLVVAELEAQRPLQQAALSEAGVKVQVDGTGGVSVTPLDPVPEND